MFFQDRLTGAALGDSEPHMSLPRKAFRDRVGVLLPIGLWDPLELAMNTSKEDALRRRAVIVKHGRFSKGRARLLRAEILKAQRLPVTVPRWEAARRLWVRSDRRRLAARLISGGTALSSASTVASCCGHASTTSGRSTRSTAATCRPHGLQVSGRAERCGREVGRDRHNSRRVKVGRGRLAAARTPSCRPLGNAHREMDGKTRLSSSLV